MKITWTITITFFCVLGFQLAFSQSKDDIVDYNKHLLDVQHDIVTSHESKVILTNDLEGINEQFKKLSYLLDSISSHIRSEEVAIKQQKGSIKILDQEIDKLRNQTIEYSNELEIKHNSLDSINEIVHALESEIKVNKQKLQLKKEQLYELEQEITQQSQTINSIRTTVIEYGEEQQKHKNEKRENETSITVQNEKLQYEQEKRNKLEQKLNNYFQQKEDLILDNKELETRISSNTSKLTENINAVKSWENERVNLRQQIQTLEKKQNDPKLQAEEYSKLTTEIQVLRDDENKRTRELHDLNQQNLSLESEISKSQRQIEVNKEDISTNENKISEYQKGKADVDITIDNIQKVIHQHQENVNKAKLEVDHLESQIIKKNGEIDILDQEKEEQSVLKNEFKDEIVRLEKEIKDTEQSVISDQEYTLKIKSEMADTRRQVAKVNKALIAKETLIVDQRALAHDMELELKTVQNDQQEIEDNKQKVQLKTDSLNSYIKGIDTSVDSILLQGIEFALEALEDTSIYFFNQAIIKNPKSEQALYLKAYTEFIHGNFDQGLNTTNKLIKIDNRYSDAFKLRALIFSYQNKYSYALKDYDHALYLNKKDDQTFIKRGNVYYDKMNNYIKGCKDYQSALSLGNKDANILIADRCNLEEKKDFDVKVISQKAIKDDYGIVSTNPIKVGKDKNGGSSNIISFLNLLRDENGKPVIHHKFKTCCPYITPNGIGGKEGLLTLYKVESKDKKGKKKTTILYFTHYDYDTPQLPVGFKTDHEIY